MKMKVILCTANKRDGHAAERSVMRREDEKTASEPTVKASSP